MDEGELKKRSVSVHDIWRTWGSCLPVKSAKKQLVPVEVIDLAKKDIFTVLEKYTKDSKIRQKLELWFGDSS